jgi:hypothetical protein
MLHILKKMIGLIKGTGELEKAVQIEQEHPLNLDQKKALVNPHYAKPETIGTLSKPPAPGGQQRRVYSSFAHPAHSNFTAAEHMDAYRAHNKRIDEMDNGKHGVVGASGKRDAYKTEEKRKFHVAEGMKHHAAAVALTTPGVGSRPGQAPNVAPPVAQPQKLASSEGCDLEKSEEELEKAANPLGLIGKAKAYVDAQAYKNQKKQQRALMQALKGVKIH